MVDEVVGERNVRLLVFYGAVYLAVICLQGGLQYLLNIVS